jgi:hypothetical protein
VGVLGSQNACAHRAFVEDRVPRATHDGCCERQLELVPMHGAEVHQIEPVNSVTLGLPPEGAQVSRLKSQDPSIRGRVVYPPAFDDVTEPH